MRQHFDLDPSIIYLNSGSFSICPRIILEAITKYQRDFELNPTRNLFEARGKLWAMQKDLAKYLNGQPQDIFVRPHVTAAINSFIMGVKLPADAEIAVSSLEYGAIANICRLRAERDRLKFYEIKIPALPTESLVDTICSQLKPKTRVLMISHVMTSNGLKIPLKELAKETRKRGVLLAVDGAHAVSALPVDLTDLQDVDFYGGNLHKWTMGPKGTGFGWIPERNHSLIELIEGGWTTFETPSSYAEFGDGNRFAAMMIMTGTYDFAHFFALTDTLNFWRTVGVSAIHETRLKLQRKVLQEMQSRLPDWKLLSPSKESERGPLIAFDLPDSLESLGYGMMTRLIQEHRLQLVTPQIHGRHCVRFSPNIYNTEEEIQRAVEILSTFK